MSSQNVELEPLDTKTDEPEEESENSSSIANDRKKHRMPIPPLIEGGTSANEDLNNIENYNISPSPDYNDVTAQKQVTHYTPQLSPNLLSNIIPTTKTIYLNKKFNKNPSRYKTKDGKNPYPLVNENTTVKEQLKYLFTGTHVLHPMGNFRRNWNVLILCLLVYTCLIVPFTIAFELDLNFKKNTADLNKDLASVALFIDLMLFIDIILNFRTSYKDYNIKSFVRDEKEIFNNYFYSFQFYLDIITSMPLELISAPGIHKEERVGDWIKVYEFIRLVKLLRLIKAIKRFGEQQEHFYGWKKYILDLSFVVFIMLYATHVSACGWWWVGQYSKDIHRLRPIHYYPNSTDYTLIIEYNSKGKIKNINGTLADSIWWGQGLLEDGHSMGKKYFISFYWAVVTLLTTGYGDITPATTQEMFYVTLVVFFGTILFGWIVGRVTELLLGSDLKTEMINKRIESAKIFCESIGLDKNQQRNVVDYVSYYGNNNYLGNTNDILVALPPDVKLSILRQEKVDHTEIEYKEATHTKTKSEIKHGGNFVADTYTAIKNFKFGKKKSTAALQNQDSLNVNHNGRLNYNNRQLSKKSQSTMELLEGVEDNTANALNSANDSKQIPFVLMAKILFGDNKLIQNDEEIFNLLGLRIKKMTIKEGELFTRSDAVETTLFITLNQCTVRYSYEDEVNYNDSNWIEYFLPPYTILGNLHSKYDVDVSIQCYQDNGCLVYIVEKEDISQALKELDYRLERHEMLKVYNKLIKTNYHGLVIPYNQILKSNSLKSSIPCSTLIDNNWTVKTLIIRKDFGIKITSKNEKLNNSSNLAPIIENIEKKENKIDEKKINKKKNNNNFTINITPPQPKIKRNSLKLSKRISKSVLDYKFKKENKEVKDFSDRELLLLLLKRLDNIENKLGINKKKQNNNISHLQEESSDEEEVIKLKEDMKNETLKENENKNEKEKEKENGVKTPNKETINGTTPNNISPKAELNDDHSHVPSQLLDDVIDQMDFFED